ncbi:MAG: hypothetical protein RM022_031750 [Nostoc sp. EfeVER01]|uniref:hypothetical protein n=1 Tax=Nostoc sp. EfeVER01 TaxID=3075406 RepID=UPI0039193DB7
MSATRCTICLSKATSAKLLSPAPSSLLQFGYATSAPVPSSDCVLSVVEVSRDARHKSRQASSKNCV